MKNIEKYGNNLKAAIAAFLGEMAERTENGIEGLPFEDWTDEDEGTTARLVAEEKERKEKVAAALADEKAYIRNAIPKLKALYKENGFEEAMAIIDEVFKLDPYMHIYEDLNSACNCMHSGMWGVWHDDFSAVWDLYEYVKNDKTFGDKWDNPVEWEDSMKGLVGYIAPFIEDGKKYLAELKAKGGKTA